VSLMMCLNAVMSQLPWSTLLAMTAPCFFLFYSKCCSTNSNILRFNFKGSLATILNYTHMPRKYYFVYYTTVKSVLPVTCL
jgi:hypothetical protein